MFRWINPVYFFLVITFSVNCFADSKAQVWAANNAWFGENKEMTDYALKIHEDLILRSETIVNTRQYYDELDKRLRTKFPYFFDNMSQESQTRPVKQEAPIQESLELFTVIGGCAEQSIDCLYIDEAIISLTNKKPKMKEQLNFFLSGPGEFRCPEGYKNYDGGNFTIEGNGSETQVSSCATASETVINNYLNDPLRLRIYSGEQCPSKNKKIFYTEKIVSCQSFERNEQKFTETDQKQQALILADSQVPLIDIFNAVTVGKQGLIAGYVTDNSGIAEVSVDGNVIPVTSDGSFEYRTFVPANGISVQVQATDLTGLTSVMSVSLQRNTSLVAATISFDRLNPIGKHAMQNSNALALIIGISDYENTPAKAVFADADAMMFRDFASEKLGISDSRIKTMVNDGAGERELLLSVKSWLSRSVKQDQSDVYIFFAGHGLASDDGSKMYLLPYDGAPELLDDTAILRDRLFSDVAAANPRSVTVFLDTCYSGTTRGTDMLIASRPIAIRALEQSIPDNFTVMTAAAGDQTAKPLEEHKHGMFSYFLMKGMEGEADANNDYEITAGELHSYVQTNVIQQSSGSQTPELQGDSDRVLVRFQ